MHTQIPHLLTYFTKLKPYKTGEREILVNSPRIKVMGYILIPWSIVDTLQCSLTLITESHDVGNLTVHVLLVHVFKINCILWSLWRGGGGLGGGMYRPPKTLWYRHIAHTSWASKSSGKAVMCEHSLLTHSLINSSIYYHFGNDFH